MKPIRLFHVQPLLIDSEPGTHTSYPIKMLLRPYYPLVSNNGYFMDEINAGHLVQLLLDLPRNARLSLLKYFNIRKLIIFLRSIAKNEPKDELYELNDVSDIFQSFWKDLITVFNDFECLILVNEYSTPNNDSELSVDSEEYEFLLEYLFDTMSEEISIRFKLIDVQTTKFNKIFKMLEKHSHGLQMSNDSLSIIKDSDNLKSKLDVLDLHTYENFEIAKKLKYKKLNVIGNEIDNFTITKLINNNSNLKFINFKNRCKDLIRLPNTEDIEIHYDIAIYDKFDQSSLSDLGNLDRINELFLNFTVETDISLEWLKNCRLLKKLYFSLSYETDRIERITPAGEFSELEHVVLKRCEIASSKSRKTLMMPKLKTISLTECAIDLSFLNQLSHDNLVDIKLVNCDITYDEVLKIPRCLQNITIINEEIKEIEDLMFLTVEGRPASSINPDRRINLNVNDFVVTLNLKDNNDIYLFKGSLNTSNLSNFKPLPTSTITISIFPHFNWFDMAFLNDIIDTYKTDKVILELYSLTNQYQKFNELDFLEKVEKRHYDVYEMFEYLQNVLCKEELSDKDKRFLINWKYVPRHPQNRSIKPEVKKRRRRTKLEMEMDEKAGNRKIKIQKTKKHSKKNTDKPKQESLSDKSGTLYTCDICDQSFSRSTALNRHSLSHEN